jgi:hypothetical protein
MSQNYKETLNLPRTGFPMKANLAGREPEILKIWEETRLYQQIQKAHRSLSRVKVIHWRNRSATKLTKAERMTKRAGGEREQAALNFIRESSSSADVVVPNQIGLLF